MNNNLPSIFDLDRDINSDIGKILIGTNPTKTSFKKTWTKDLVHFRHCLTSVEAQKPAERSNCTTIIIDESYQIFDYIANLIVSFKTTSVIDPKTIFKHIDKLIVKFGDTEVLDFTGLQLETIMKTRPDYYKKMTRHNDKFVISIQGLLMEAQPTVLNYQITIELYFTDNFNVYDQLATFEGYRTIDHSYRRNKLCSTENHIYTYYFNNYENKCNYVIDTPVDVPIHGVIVIVKSCILPDQSISVKFGDIDMISCSNPYFEHNDIMVPIDNAYSYISRPPSLNLHDSCTGLVIGHKDLKINVTSDQPINIEVLHIIDNALGIDGIKLSESTDSDKLESTLEGCKLSGNVSVMVPIKYHELLHEPIKGSPLHKINDIEFIEGYWANLSPIYDRERTRFKYNLPIVTDIPVDPKFMEKLNNMIDNDECESTHYCGFSTCRICDKGNGSSEYKLSNGDISFKFPEGLIHYYKDHNVQPSEQFYHFIMKL